MAIKRTAAQRRKPWRYKPCDCGRGLRDRYKDRCRLCYLEAVVCPPCEVCGAPLRSSRTRLCRTCYMAQRHRNGTLQFFSADWLRGILEDDDAEWTPELIEVATGGLVHRSTIQYWLAGKHKPTREAWELVKRALCLEACRSCGGTGTAYDDARAARFNPPEPEKPSPRPVQIDRARMPRVLFVGGLVFDPDQRGLAAPNGAEIALTGRELELMAAALDLCANRWARPSEVANALGWLPHNAAVNATRIRSKIRDAGHDWRKWWRIEQGRGWKLAVQTLHREEAAS